MPVDVVERKTNMEYRAIDGNDVCTIGDIKEGRLCVILDGALSGELVVKMFATYVQPLSMGIRYEYIPGSTKVRLMRQGDAVTLVVR